MEEIKREIINKCIKGIKNGDEECLNTLYEIFSPRLYYIGLKYFRDCDIHDFVQDFWSDIQDICLKCVFVINGFGYLMKVAENRARNKYNKDKYRCNYEVVDIEQVKDYSYNETGIEQLEKNEIVENFFKELDNMEKKIIHMYFYESKTIRAISKEIKMPTSTIEYKKLKALEKLKKFL